MGVKIDNVIEVIKVVGRVCAGLISFINIFKKKRVGDEKIK